MSVQPAESSTTRRANRFGPSALLTPANMVTLARIAIAPFAFAMILHNGRNDPDKIGSWPMLGLWFVLSMSDMFDGKLARKFGTTRSGAFLDPLADKVMVIGGFAAVAAVGRFPWIVVILTAIRELGISALRSYWARKGLAVPATALGKYKAFVQLGAVGWVTWPPPVGQAHWLADSFLWVSLALAWISGIQYVVAGRSLTSEAGERVTADHRRNT